ncbi:MAG: LysM peptidoglycan-binding domain-containing protein [Actinobacteria bacterium]|nr:MAG: LysM peptidoglycan-binding domain-containing protein [Actinomycetota bacterium]
MRAARIVSVPLALALLAPVTAFAAAPSKPGPAPGRVYVVRSGDNLETIAKRNGTTVPALAAANHIINPNLVVIGTKLKIPAPSAAKLPTRLLAHPERLALTPRFDHWAKVYGVPPDLLKGLAWYESGWQNQVVSKTGAVGVGQLEPFTSDFVSKQLLSNPALDPKRVDDNIRMSARFLRFLLDRTGGAPGLALAAYYQGLKMTQQGKFFDDTKTYVAGVSAARVQFK